jgi:pilus assembly protein CpaB
MVLVFVFFAAVMALLTAYLAKVWLDSRTPVTVVQQQNVEPTGVLHVLVAARPIATGVRLTRDDFTWALWPKAALQDRFIDESKISEAALDAQAQPPTGPTTPIVNAGGDQGAAAASVVIIGAVARRQILQGEPIGLESIVQPGDHSTGAAVIAPGMRAYSIPIQAESASAGFINPGDRVDVLLAANLRSAIDGRNADEVGLKKKDDVIINWATETVLYNAKVLAIDQQLAHDPKDGAAVVGKILTLEVTPFDAEKLFAAQQLGAFSVTLRSLMSDRSDSAAARDVDNPSSHPFTSDKEASRALNSLSLSIGTAPDPAPAPAPEANTVVRVNRGGIISEQSF